MLTKNQIKHINSLKTKKSRYVHKEFIVEGEKCVKELIESGFKISGIYAVHTWIEKNGQLLGKKDAGVFEITEDELKKISSFGAPNMVIATACIPFEKSIPADFFSDLIIVLDEIRDPGNLGMIIRTADWFGIKNIVCSKGSVDAYNPKVVQASMGSLFRVGVYYTELASFIKKAPADVPVYGSSLYGEAITDIDLTRRGVIIIGNESDGISSGLLPLIDKMITISRFPAVTQEGGRAESLNAALACAVICYEFRRRRVHNGD